MAAAAVATAQHMAGRSARPNFEVELQAIEDYRRFAALTIQRHFRGWIVRLHRARKESTRREHQQSAAAQQAEAASLYKAARMIQDSWRCYKNKRIYRFFRDLIRFREAAEPRQLLRCINAYEAALVDPAAGLHVRLRLGGNSFPPVLLYKVFTHRPVTDICAFGPRNYAAETAPCKQTAATTTAASAPAQQPAPACTQQSQASHTNSSSSKHVNRAGWYCRDDRNGWRPVVELQQQQDRQHSSSCSSSRSRHRAMPLMPRRSRLQLAHSNASSIGAKWAAAGCAGLKDVVGGTHEGEEEGSGCGSEAGLLADTHEYLQRSKQQHYFHHSPLIRRAERAQRLKQRRRQWLLKMYRTGMQAVSGGSSSGCAAPAAVTQQISTSGALPCADHVSSSTSSQQQQGSAHYPMPCQACSQEEQLLCQLEQQLLVSQGADSACSTSSSSTVLPNALQPGSSAGRTSSTREGLDGSWDLDELILLGLDAGILTWAQKLDYNSYQQQWSSTAVTLGSEVVVPQSERTLLQQLS